MSERWHEMLLISQTEMEKLDPKVRGIPVLMSCGVTEGRLTFSVWPMPEKTIAFAVKIDV